MKTNETNEAAGRSRPWESFPTTSPTRSFLRYLRSSATSVRGKPSQSFLTKIPIGLNEGRGAGRGRP